jgi:hypothetical protein
MSEFQTKCNYCNRIIAKESNIFYIFDNPTCSLLCQHYVHHEILIINPGLDKPELWNLNRERSKSF